MSTTLANVFGLYFKNEKKLSGYIRGPETNGLMILKKKTNTGK